MLLRLPYPLDVFGGGKAVGKGREKREVIEGRGTKNILATWLNEANVEDLLDEAVVSRDLVDCARCVLYTDDVHGYQVVRHSTPEHLSVLFAHLEYLRPQPVNSRAIIVPSCVLVFPSILVHVLVLSLKTKYS